MTQELLRPLEQSIGMFDDNSSDYMLIKGCLINERASPEILPFKGDLIQRLQARIEEQVRTLHISVSSLQIHLMHAYR